MVKTFRTAFFEYMDAHPDVSLNAWCNRAGVSYEQIKKFKQRAVNDENASTNVDDARKLANAAGYSIDEFLEDTTAADRAEAAAQYSQLSNREMEFLRVLAKAQRAEDREAES